MLADAVEPKYFGRAYGLERAGDMLGAVVRPLIAVLLQWGGVEFRTIILWTIIPGLLAAGVFFFLTKEKATVPVNGGRQRSARHQSAFPKGILVVPHRGVPVWPW